MRGNGLFAIKIHSLTSLHTPVTAAGANPFDNLAFAVDGDQVRFKEYMTTGWQPARDVPSMVLKDVTYNLNGLTNHTFSTIFPIYDWKDNDGYNNIGTWIEAAAKQAGR